MNWKILIEWIRKIWTKPVVIPTPPPIPVPPPQPVPVKETGQEKLYETAKSYLGTDASPRDVADDDVACVETFDNIHYHAFGEYLNGSKTKPILSTVDAYDQFMKHPKWEQTFSWEPGNAILSVTGRGNGAFYHGHIGIFGEDKKIMSNNSKDGLFLENYTLKKWVDYFRVKGGFKVYMFKRID